MPHPLAEFLAGLRVSGFAVSLETEIRVADLLARLDGQVHPARLRSLICPLVAGNADEQRKFLEAFDLHFPTRIGEESIASVPPPLPPPRRRWLRVAIGMAIVACGLYWATRPKQTGPQLPSASDAVTIPAPPPAPPSGPRQYFEPTMSTSFRVTPVQPWSAGTKALFALPLALLLAGLLWNRFWRRRAVLESRVVPGAGRDTRGKRHAFRAPGHAHALFNAVRRLRRPREAEIRRLDPGATVRATIESLGFPRLRYRTLTRRPEYLILADRQGPRDHQAALLGSLTDALRDQGLIAHVYHYSRDPRVCHAARTGEPFYLDDLRHRHFANRLVIVGDCDALLEPLGREWSAAAVILRQWRQRAVLTPKPAAEWGVQEAFVAGRPARERFDLLPATSAGVELLALLWETDRHPPAPAVRDKESVLTELGPAPALSQARAVLPALRARLGGDGFRCLCVCAVQSRLQWDLTLRLIREFGPDLFQQEEKLLRLFRLPWFRSGWIPVGLADALVLELDAASRHQARDTVREFLAELGPADGATPEEARFEIMALRSGMLPSEMEEIRDDDVLAELVRTIPEESPGVALPEALRRLLFRHGVARLGIPRSRLAAAGLLGVALLAVLAWPRVGAIDIQHQYPSPPPHLDAGWIPRSVDFIGPDDRRQITCPQSDSGCIELLESLRSLARNEAAYAEALELRGLILARTLEPYEAQISLEMALAIREALAKQDPTSAKAQSDLSVCLTNLGDVLVAAGKLGQARVRFEQALGIFERLAKENPTSAQAQRDVRVILDRLQDPYSGQSGRVILPDRRPAPQRLPELRSTSPESPGRTR